MRNLHRRAVVCAFLVSSIATGLARADLKLLLPLGRVAYQTNESIDLAVVRSSPTALPASRMTLRLQGEDGAQFECQFPLKAIPVIGADARTTEHFRLNAALLRPGKYTITVSANGATASTNIELYSHIRRSTFRLIDWASHAKDQEQALLGQDSLGFNLIYAAYGGISPDNLIRGGADYMRCCTMGGGHQMDLRSECDWSDPYVLAGAEARVVREALACRTNPNAIGVHFYDEPGLTWIKHAKTGVPAPYNLPSQDRSYRSAFAADPIQYTDVKPDDPAAVARWNHMNRWKESFIDAAWKYSSFGVSWVRNDLLSATQTVYGFSAYADGYYFNAARSLPVISGHGGYDDWGPGYWNPSWTFEMGRMRDLAKPNWYLPMWASNMPTNQYRMEMYLSFMMNLQGVCKPPDAKVHNPWSTPNCADGIVETNRLLARLGTIFTTLPIDRGPVAMLYSMSQIQHAQVRDMQDPAKLNASAYDGGGHSRSKILLAYLAGKMIHQSLFPIVEEDILDGTLAAHHRAVVLPGIDYLEPPVISALEAYIAAGGAVLVSDESKVQIKGATRIGCPLTTEASDRIATLHKQGKSAEANKLEVTDYYLQAARPLATALQAKLKALNITPALDADSPSIITSRQGSGDVEYLFAVNATYDPAAGQRNSIKSAEATLSIPADQRPIYDVIHATPVIFPRGTFYTLAKKFRFGPGQMHMFARTSRPLGAVEIASPTITRDYTLPHDPIRLNLSAVVMDIDHRILSGSIPLRIRISDPLGQSRYDLYRATEQGTLKLTLPLSATDPSGMWTITVDELISGQQGSAVFTIAALPQCGAVAGMVPRALFFGNDRENAFRFGRLYRDITIIRGSSDYNTAAAQRLTEILKPWNIRCRTIDAAQANQPRQLEPEELPTSVGLEMGRLNTREKPRPQQVGFAVEGPAILLGTPDDNPLIKFAADHSFLPYKLDKLDFPGRARGLLTWQRDAISYGSESLMLIAYDGNGMSEAVGTLYEAVAALDPLTPLDPPATATITPATKSTARGPEAKIAWKLILPDRPVSMKLTDNTIEIITNDGSLATLDPTGKLLSVKPLPPNQTPPTIAAPPQPKVPPTLAKTLLPTRIPKFILPLNDQTAVAYWGGTLETFDANGAIKTSQLLPHDITNVLSAGNSLIVAQSDGSVIGIK